MKPEESAPSTEKIYVFKWKRFLGSFSRGFCQFIIQVVIMNTFYFTAQTGINSGIIASVFSTNLIFVTMYFYFVHGQRITLSDLIGSLLIVTCLVLIGVGSQGNTNQ